MPMSLPSRLLTLLALMGAAAGARAEAPKSIPLRIVGDVVTATGAFEYVADWDDALGGYNFTPPGRPSAWASGLLTVDAAGLATIGDSSVDWSKGPLGRPVAAEGYAFTPKSVDYGYGWYLPRFMDKFGYGMLTGLAFDLFLNIYAATLGAFSREVTRIY